MHPNPSALHNRIAPADIGHINQVTITSRWHAFRLVRTANLEKAISVAVRPALIHPRPDQIVERLHYEVRKFRRVILIAVFAASPNSRAATELEFQHFVSGTTPANVSPQARRKRKPERVRVRFRV